MKNINPKGIREEYISLQQAAEIYGCTQKNMALMARRGKIKAMKIGNHWVTTKKWLDDYADSVKDVGRPEKPKSYKLEINLFKSKQGKIFKKYLTTTFVIALTFLSLVSFYSAAKPRVAPAVNLIVGKVEKFVSLNSRNINEFPSQAIIETNKVIASVFGVDSNNKINKTSETIVRRIVSGYKKTVRDINNFFKNIFLGIDKFLDNCGKFVINATCDTINSTIHTFTNTKELTDKIAKKIPFFSIIPSPIGDFVVSVPTTIAKVANNLIASFKSFFPFYLTLDGSGNQTLISIRDLYKKIKELRELIEGKAILVNQITQQITVVKPETIVPVSGTTPIDISAQLAVFKNEILSQIAEDITNVQSKIGQTLVTQNNYYYSEAVESSRIDVVNNDITFNEQVAMKKNLSVDGNLTVLGTTTFSGGVLMTGVAINDLIINNLLNASHASVSDDLTASIAEITDLTSTNLLTNSLIFATASGSNAEITSAGFDNLRAITITDNILLINSGNIINGQNFSFVGASISDWLTIGDSVSIVNSLTSTNIFGTHASISDDLEILSANIASASIGTLYNAIFDTTNLIATHTSVSDDLTIGDDVSFVDGIASISGATNIYGVLTLYGNLIGVRASLSDSLTVT
ncbi:MAG TPA: helix-turn-helix domain-containing protein, partial [Candidatus Portnoybacteria bacterium]|nr:helix-turn-helix domain-containing protein [Candidatus Portnoybacteria bacterium]HPH52148.1 helix-turn-helix domain-containing protein [Candidatus Portnoybacteria bacterium]HPM28480.1 helix-turn-helix domain-containing protein [Candidatus Portnoybacteria bacterium]